MNFVICIFFINISLIYSYITDEGKWEAIKLENGNFIVLTENGLYTLSPTFQILNYTEEVDGYFGRIIKQFKKEDGSNILVINGSKHYILNSDGNLLYTYKVDSSWYIQGGSIILYNHLRDVFSYYIISIDEAVITLYKYSYNSINQKLEIRDFKLINSSEINKDYITCQLMKYLNESVISCFFPTSFNDENFINCTVFKAEENFEIIKISYIKIKDCIYDGLKSEVMSTDDRQKVFIIFFIDNSKNLFYAGYDINNNNFTYGILIPEDIFYNYISYSSISYFKETEEFIVSFFMGLISYKDISYSDVYFIYSINKNFDASFFGLLNGFDLEDSLCNISPFLTYGSNKQKIFFSSIAQKYCTILNSNYSKIISLFIINKEINIINPTELNLLIPHQILYVKIIIIQKIIKNHQKTIL